MTDSRPIPAGFALDRRTSIPMQRQLYQRVREAIAAGTLRPGERLPSSRGLAAQLGIARGTVDAAYALLLAEGYIVTRGPAGSIVSPQLADAPPTTRARLPTRPTAGAAVPTPAIPLFQLGLPALDAFPRKLWCRLATREARALRPGGMAYPDPAGYTPLREAIAAYLAVSRGIVCSAEQVIVTAGYQGALALIARVLLRGDDRVCLEDPCYFLARQALQLAGATLLPVAVDGEGLRVADGVAQLKDVRLVVVTPSHQSPLGMTLSLPRRLALLAWAGDADAWIVEDDYDSEFRYTGPPSPALKSLDAQDRVLYCGSFSKVLMPGLRLGYLVVPEPQIGAFTEATRLMHGGQSVLPQAVVARFMAEGHFPRHLRRMRTLYADRRAALATALTAECGDQLRVTLQAGGMHLIARLPPTTDDKALSARANAAGLAVAALSEAAMQHACGPGLLLGFTNIPTETAPLAARLLRAVMQGMRG